MLGLVHCNKQLKMHPTLVCQNKSLRSCNKMASPSEAYEERHLHRLQLPVLGLQLPEKAWLDDKSNHVTQLPRISHHALQDCNHIWITCTDCSCLSLASSWACMWRTLGIKQMPLASSACSRLACRPLQPVTSHAHYRLDALRTQHEYTVLSSIDAGRVCGLELSGCSR